MPGPTSRLFSFLASWFLPALAWIVAGGQCHGIPLRRLNARRDRILVRSPESARGQDFVAGKKLRERGRAKAKDVEGKAAAGGVDR